MNFARDVVDAADPASLALVALGRDGTRSEHSLRRGVRPLRRGWRARSPQAASRAGDVVMTVVGNRPEWVDALVACFRIGAVALPCTEQLRPADLRARMDAAEPRAVVADERNAERRARRAASTAPTARVRRSPTSGSTTRSRARRRPRRRRIRR